MEVFILNSILLVIILILFVLLSMVWPPDSPWSPWWKTDKKVSQVIGDMVRLSKSDVIYELGSGDGEFLLVAGGLFGAKVVGIEIDPFRYYQSLFRVKRARLEDKITVKRANFFAEDLSPATVLYFYLVPRAIGRLLPKLQKELRPGTKIVSYRYKLPFRPIMENKEHKLYVYMLPKKSRAKS